MKRVKSRLHAPISSNEVFLTSDGSATSDNTSDDKIGARSHGIADCLIVGPAIAKSLIGLPVGRLSSGYYEDG